MGENFAAPPFVALWPFTTCGLETAVRRFRSEADIDGFGRAPHL